MTYLKDYTELKKKYILMKAGMGHKDDKIDLINGEILFNDFEKYLNLNDNKKIFILPKFYPDPVELQKEHKKKILNFFDSDEKKKLIGKVFIKLIGKRERDLRTGYSLFDDGIMFFNKMRTCLSENPLVVMIEHDDYEAPNEKIKSSFLGYYNAIKLNGGKIISINNNLYKIQFITKKKEVKCFIIHQKWLLPYHIMNMKSIAEHNIF